MRETDPIEPTWENARVPGPAGRAVGVAVALAARLARLGAPHLHRWASGHRPDLVVAWGAREYALRRRGVVRRRRSGDGWDDNPRSNYNDAVERRQRRQARAEPAPAPEPPAPPALEAPTADPAGRLDLSEGALRAGVAAAMGTDLPASEDDALRDPEALKAALVRIRATLQALDDVQDWGVVQTVDDELYKLHKAVEYKLRNHRASEAKAKLDGLFKS